MRNMMSAPIQLCHWSVDIFSSPLSPHTFHAGLKKNIQEMVAPIQRNNKLRLCPVTVL
uniref:Uncharacterized protein n=1 Tax=Octopus bimaculoides TaxID=37653 RepID=A0A0L8FQ12_OCTBM